MSAADPLLGTAFDGKYHVTALLGEGGMARVYAATSLLDGKDVALKVIRPHHAGDRRVIARFQREARVVAALAHPNIARTFETGLTVAGSPYIIMERLTGHSLREILDDGPMESERAVEIACQILCGLRAAHNAHIVHRDLKPENVFIDDAGNGSRVAKLLDFGISKLMGPQWDGVSSLTKSGVTIGTPGYMSPEQALGARHVSQRSDIYSMGVMLYEMLTGCLPFDAGNQNALVVRLLIESPPDPRRINPRIPIALARTIRRAMDRQPAKRFAHCSAFIDQLGSISAAPGEVARRDGAADSNTDVSVTDKAAPEGRSRDVCLAFFVGPPLPQGLEFVLDEHRLLSLLPLEGETDLTEALEGPSPHGIISTIPLDVESLGADAPGLRAPIVVIDPSRPHEELSVFERAASSEPYTLRRAPISALNTEVTRFFLYEPAIDESRGAVHEIGYSSVIELGDRVIDVVTEVRTRSGVEVVSRVWEGGRIVDQLVRTRYALATQVSTVRELALAQHRQVVRENKEPPPAEP